jgi:arginyl-tRNA--protein-N-Asp/Glu arginylyltransferase
MARVQNSFTEGQCGYYGERVSRNHCISDDRHELSRFQITRILNKGYRRYGVDYYKPYCRNCRECTPYRVSAVDFKPNRSFKRTLKRNAATQVVWAEPKPTQEKFELYVRYQLNRHKDLGEKSLLTVRKNLAAAMIQQMYMNPKDALELTVSENNAVIAFAVFDVTDDSLSAVYSVFEPGMAERSLGTFNILCGIDKVRELNLPYLNLGLYLAEHEKMAYKANFGPAEIYAKYSWVKFDDSDRRA